MKAGPPGEALVASGFDIVTNPESSTERSGFFLLGTEKSSFPAELDSLLLCEEGKDTGLTPRRDFKAEEL